MALLISILCSVSRPRADWRNPGGSGRNDQNGLTPNHYMVPEFVKGQAFKLTRPSCWMKWTKRWRLVIRLNLSCWGRSLICGWGKVKGEQFDRLSLLKDILPVYQQVLAELAKRGIEWVQIDEPALVLELPQAWLEAFKTGV